jgi:hypothetical protein
MKISIEPEARGSPANIIDWLTAKFGVENTALSFNIIANILIPSSFIYAN